MAGMTDARAAALYHAAHDTKLDGETVSISDGPYVMLPATRTKPEEVSDDV